MYPECTCTNPHLQVVALEAAHPRRQVARRPLVVTLLRHREAAEQLVVQLQHGMCQVLGAAGDGRPGAILAATELLQASRQAYNAALTGLLRHNIQHSTTQHNRPRHVVTSVTQCTPPTQHTGAKLDGGSQLAPKALPLLARASQDACNLTLASSHLSSSTCSHPCLHVWRTPPAAARILCT